MAFSRFVVFFGLLVHALLVSALAQTQHQDGNRPPNIVLILTDDQGYHEVSYYGTPDIRTPNIDAVAAAGMRFDNFYANCPVCSPTRAALLTGRYQDQVGVPGVIRSDPKNSWGYLNPKATLLPQALKGAGYHTALIGKWHLGLQTPNTPVARGFDFFYGWLGDMMDDYWTHRRHGINYMRRNQTTIDPKGHATDLFTQWAVRYIEERAKEPQPFFLYLAYNAPHFPVQPPEEWVAKVMQRQKGIDPVRARLIAFIEHLDAGIGEVLHALRKSGQWENTLVVFTSDNGGHLPSKANNGPLREGKQSMYEGGLKVPTAISWPGHIQAGSVTTSVQLTMDLYPSLLAAAGVTPANAIAGQDFLPELLGRSGAKNAERPLYFVRREGGTRYAGQAIYALRKGDWKLLQNTPYAPFELYNLKTDPLEATNVIHDQPEKYKELNALLMQYMQEGGQVPWQRSH